MNFIRRRFRGFCLFIINHFFKGTRFFSVKRNLLNICGIQVGSNTNIVAPFNVSNCSKIIIGNNCWIGSGFTIYGDGKVEIGDNCDFGPDVALITGSHEIGYDDRRAGKGVLFSIKIEDGCWFGARSSVVGNTIIKRMSVVGACSLVTKIVDENIVVAGTPAKVIKEL